MKKIVAMLLCLVLLGCCTAYAETAEKELLGAVNVNGAFNIKCKMPEGYKLSILESSSDYIIAVVASEDEAKPSITLSVAFNDSYTQDGKAMRLNDLSEEEILMIKESFMDTADEVSFEDSMTAYGTKVMIVKGMISDTNFVEVYSVYNSYEVEMLAVAGKGAEEKTLSDTQIQMIIDFLSDMDFEVVTG